jgi:hypothetical protein
LESAEDVVGAEVFFEVFFARVEIFAMVVEFLLGCVLAVAGVCDGFGFGA